jgi:hypothetical protein
MYIPTPEAKAQALITDQLDVQKTSEEIGHLLKETERDYPELQMDIWTAGEDTSGRALRQARQRVEKKVVQRRATYDGALVRAHQMAIAIGGFRGYVGYQGFDLKSYEKGDLDHTITPSRPIFEIDPRELADERKLFWEAVRAATDAGTPLETVLLEMGWDDTKIAAMKVLIDAADKKKVEQDAAKAEQELKRLEAVRPAVPVTGNPSTPKSSSRGAPSM